MYRKKYFQLCKYILGSEGNCGVEARWPYGQCARFQIQRSGDILLCSWARHFIFTVPLSKQEYKWLQANLMLVVAVRRTRKEQNQSQSLHATETGVRFGSMGQLARVQTLTLLFNCRERCKSMNDHHVQQCTKVEVKPLKQQLKFIALWFSGWWEDGDCSRGLNCFTSFRQ